MGPVQKSHTECVWLHALAVNGDPNGEGEGYGGHSPCLKPLAEAAPNRLKALPQVRYRVAHAEGSQNQVA